LRGSFYERFYDKIHGGTRGGIGRGVAYRDIFRDRGEPHCVTGGGLRLDKYLSEAAVCSRSEAAKAARAGKITVNGVRIVSAAVHIDPEADVVTFFGKTVEWKRFTYIMLNKPKGYVSSTEDGGRTVMDLLPPECAKKKMFPCGRLDIDTTGLLLITNDGESAHRLLSPARHVKKTYAFTVSSPVGDGEKVKLEGGVDIGGHISAPAEIELDTPASGRITITEGKFHQIKRMFHAVGTEVTELERVSFGPLTLDGKLARGEYRELTEEEEAALLETAK